MRTRWVMNKPSYSIMIRPNYIII